MIGLELARKYLEHFTVGELSLEGVHLSFSLELPYRENQRNISCIKEGFCPLRFRKSSRFREDLHVMEVEDRKWILLHPANDAQKELGAALLLL